MSMSLNLFQSQVWTLSSRTFFWVFGRCPAAPTYRYLLSLATCDSLSASWLLVVFPYVGHLSIPGSPLGQSTSGPWKTYKHPRSAKLWRYGSHPRQFFRLTIQAHKPATITARLFSVQSPSVPHTPIALGVLFCNSPLKWVKDRIDT